MFKFFSLCGQAYRFLVMRPLQRFNIENRAKDYLGPEAKHFEPAPRFKSVSQGRTRKKELSLQTEPTNSSIQTELEDKYVVSLAKRMEVKKVVLGSRNESSTETHRPLPKSTNLPLNDPASIWIVNKVPPGRLDLNMLQELMLNKLADDKLWTPKALSERYNIKEEYAEQLTKYLKHIRLIVSPRMKKIMDLTGRNNPLYQASKDFVYIVDKRLRNETDRQFDDMFLPDEEWPDEVKAVLDPPGTVIKIDNKSVVAQQIAYQSKRPAPLRIKPSNEASSQQNESQPKRLE